MEPICPNPRPWLQVYKRLCEYAECHDCEPVNPPKPLILAGWVHSNDIQKLSRWQETVLWAKKNGCGHLLEGLTEDDLYHSV
jgi:hypothetical protein